MLARATTAATRPSRRPYRELEHPARTVGANLEIAGAASRPQGARPPARAGRMARSRARASTRCWAVELEGAAGRAASTRSACGSGSGWRRRCSATEVLILDEPANGLDPQGIRWLRDFLAAWPPRAARSRRATCWRGAQTSTTWSCIHRGQLVDQGPVSRLTAGGHVIARSPRAGEPRRRRARRARGDRRRRLLVDRRRRPGPRRRARLRGRDPAARADHARHLARGGLPGADGRRGGHARDPARPRRADQGPHHAHGARLRPRLGAARASPSC